MAINYTRYDQSNYAADQAAAAAAKARLAGMTDQSTGGTYRWGVQTRSPYVDQDYQDAFGASQQAQQKAAAGQQDLANTRVYDATYGRGNDVMADPRMTAAMDALDPTRAQNNLYSQLTDATAAQAGSQSDMLREQMAQAGIQLNDPAAQARLRGIETGRMQANNAGLATSQQAGMSAASQMAQMRLSQMGLANQSYSQGASMDAQRQFGPQVSAGYRTQVPAYQAQPQQAGQQPAASPYQPWQPNTPATGTTQTKTAAPQAAGMSVAQRNAAQAAWAASQTKKPAGTYTPARQGIPAAGQWA